MLRLLFLLGFLLDVENLVGAVLARVCFWLTVRVVLLVDGANEALDRVVGLLAVDVDLDDVVHVRGVVVV